MRREGDRIRGRYIEMEREREREREEQERGGEEERGEEGKRR